MPSAGDIVSLWLLWGALPAQEASIPLTQYPTHSCLLNYAHCCPIYNSQEMETT